VNARHLPAATAVSPADAGWTYSGLRVVTLAPGEHHTLATGEEEMLVLPLSGGFVVECAGEVIELEGRTSVFTRVSDFAYVPRDSEVAITSAAGGRIALPSARCERRLRFRHAKAEDVSVELRGAGSCSRQVNNVAAAHTFECDRLIVVEVLTPAGNWSSYPPHKHDEDRAGHESVLEEIYYYEVADGPDGQGMAYQRVYGTDDRPADLLVEVRTGDVVTIPHGWHGPSMAAPGYDLYYLNVMAGPGAERAWLICDDPGHAWVRGTWEGAAVDSRLPLATTDERSTR
jgi:5-deoxy-glucuronate isomerase